MRMHGGQPMNSGGSRKPPANLAPQPNNSSRCQGASLRTARKNRIWSYERMNSARIRLIICAVATFSFGVPSIAPAQSLQPAAPSVALPEAQSLVPGKFVDITEKAGVHFLHQAPHTSRKYLIETMGSGVALFDCD